MKKRVLSLSVFLTITIASFFLLCIPPVIADDIASYTDPLKSTDVNELRGHVGQTEVLIKFSHGIDILGKEREARVVIANYPLLKKDFSFLEKVDNDSIDKWLIDNAAFMSEKQSIEGHMKSSDGKRQKVNTVFSYGEKDKSVTKRLGWRPKGYGRAFVAPAYPLGESGSSKMIGLLDLKGVGVAKDSKLEESDHRTGVGSLSSFLMEYMWGLTFAAILDNERSKKKLGKDLKIVGIYAVIDTGFDANTEGRKGGRTFQPAGILVRQAHTRASSKNDRSQLEYDEQINVVNVLRPYGVMSAQPENVVNIAGTTKELYFFNIQGADKDTLVDFGTYYSVNNDTNYKNYKLSPVYKDYKNDLKKSEKPDEKLVLPEEFRKFMDDLDFYEEGKIAEKWRKDEITRDQLDKEAKSIIQKAKEKWKK